MGVIRSGFLLFVLLVTASGAAAGDGPHVGKPQVPILLQFGTEGAVAVGADLTITLTVTPLVPSESATVSVTLPEGLRLISGDTAWTGTLAKDAGHVLTMTVRPEPVSSATRLLEVQGKAALTMPNGGRISRLAVLTLDLNPTQSKPRPRERRGSGGDSIIEIPAQGDPKTK